MTTERRLFTRFYIERGDFYVFSHADGIIGKLRNIGLGGSAYQYTPLSGQAAKDTRIDIRVADAKRYDVLDIACRKVYDISELTVDGKFSGSETRLCGVRFINLSADQKHRLNFLLESCFIHTAGVSCF